DGGSEDRDRAVASFEGECQRTAILPDRLAKRAIPKRGGDEVRIEHRTELWIDVHFPTANLTCGGGIQPRSGRGGRSQRYGVSLRGPRFRAAARELCGCPPFGAAGELALRSSRAGVRGATER